MSPLQWTTTSTRHLAAELTRQGHQISADTVADVLREEGFRCLQGNAKTVEGWQHPDRDGQFRYINEQAKDHIGAGDPVISVDTKKCPTDTGEPDRDDRPRCRTRARGNRTTGRAS